MTPRPAPRPPTHDPIPREQIWGGAGAMLIGMLIIALFAQTLRGSQGLRLASGAVTPTATTSAPTPTPAPVPAEQAWGGAIIQQPLTLPGDVQFIPSDALQQNGGITLVGVAQTGTGAGAQHQIALLPLAGTSARQMYTMPTGANLPAIQADGRFVVWVGGSDYTGAGPARQIVGYFDLQTRLYLIQRNAPQIVVNPHAFAVGNGYFAWTLVSDPMTIYLTNLLAGSTATVPLSQSIAQDVTQPILMENGNVVYITADHILHLYAIATGAETTLPFIPITPASGGNGGTQIAFAGDTIFWTQPAPNAPGSTAVESIAHPGQGSSASQAAALLPGNGLASLAVNDGLIAWTASGHYFAWDRAQNRAILLGALPDSGAALGIHGNILWYVTAANGQLDANIVDTAHLP